MDERKPKKREWVKNAAIIFLAVMLVLTFFSNTILNRTLPEVVTRYVEPNSIDAKVRVSGTVSARENYDVIIDQTRKVAAVNVKLGQEVSTGDVLFTLESGDSEELENAKKQLEDAQVNYQRFLLGLSSADYTADNREIEQTRKDLAKAIEKRDGLPLPTQEALSAAEAAVARAQPPVDELNALIKEYELNRKEAELGLKHSSDGSETPEEKQDAVRTAANEKRNAKNDYLAALRAFGDEYDAFKYAVLDQIAADKHQTLTDDEREFVIDILDEIFWLSVVGYEEEIINRYNASDSVLAEVKQALAAEDRSFGIVTLKPVEKNETKEQKNKRVLRETTLRTDYADRITDVVKEDDIYSIASDTQIAAFSIISDAEKSYREAADALRNAEEALSSWLAENPGQDAVKYEGKTHAYWQKQFDKIQLEIDELTLQRDTEQDELDKAQAALDDLKKQCSERETAGDEVDRLQKSLEDQLFALSQRQKAEGKTQQLNALDIQEKQKELEELQKKIEELSGSVATEVKAKVNGTVASLSVSAGHKAEAGNTLATIEVKDLGYTMTSTVSVDQARLLHVGDTASVSNYYWGSKTTAVLSGMQPDPKDPRSSRILTFDIAGDISAGDSISFSIGERNASYDLVVPNSAVRNDTNGSFVLMITAKNSPLGNRYFATRVDVEVIASDDYNTAIKGALSNMDSVITTSSGNAPVANGDQVRLADTN